MRVLLSFVGNHDPRGPAGDAGPVLSLLGSRPFDRAYLFCTGEGYYERAKDVERNCEGCTKFHFIDLSLDLVVDYEEIYRKLSAVTGTITSSLTHQRPEYSVLLDPGTPQMQTCWVLLVASGALDAKLLQGIPAKFAGGEYRTREVIPSSSWIPARLASPAPSSQGQAGRWIRVASGPDLVGKAPGFLSAIDRASKAAAFDVSVLLLGETGTGKEVFARLIHERSTRAGGPFVPVNCGNLSSAMVESELFGHKKGSFTNAIADRLGKFRAAEAGTLFLDEVGDLPLDVQPKLLRSLEQKTVCPLGEDREVPVDTRLIAATNRDLTKMVGSGTFRADLLERLSALTVTIPPLRDREGDIDLLLDHFVAAWVRVYQQDRLLSPEARFRLVNYSWPGNVRQLRNVVEEMLLLSTSTEVGPESIPDRVLRGVDPEAAELKHQFHLPRRGIRLREVLAMIEEDYVREALRRTGGNREKAARLLGINAPALRKALRERLEVEDAHLA